MGRADLKRGRSGYNEVAELRLQCAIMPRHNSCQCQSDAVQGGGDVAAFLPKAWLYRPSGSQYEDETQKLGNESTDDDRIKSHHNVQTKMKIDCKVSFEEKRGNY